MMDKLKLYRPIFQRAWTLKLLLKNVPGNGTKRFDLGIPMVDTGTYFYGTIFVLYDIIVIVGKVDTLTRMPTTE
ncbi:hypothetical protein H7992_16460 [Sporosarcina sp. resist]|uniref:hypothetical protein n=1 Tax=Sporosarcina sp. resist TaxID=2762563 RepID=UPI00164E94F5|nr:hypothetical protein [Sporosarcina sp. resist]QNK86816.1 hypothetical protein H7992_16460 [Sporosarcina sp. resist]